MHIEVRPGFLYFFKGKEDERVRELVTVLRSTGYRLLVVSSRTSAAVKDDLGTPIDSVLTLTESMGQDCIDPENLLVLTDSVIKFIERGGPSVFLMQDLGPMKEKNEFPKLLNMIGYIYETLATNRSIGIVVFDPKTLDQKEMAYLGKEGLIVEEKDRLDMRSLQPRNHLERPPSQNL
jgi:hypothetical protein